ncbi:MAG: PEP-CTERM sorting domain-containing protein, partial [Phycisphaerae bacterium]
LVDGQYHNVTSYLDTGASSVVFSTATATSLGLNPVRYPDPVTSNPVVFNDVGSTGTAAFQVSDNLTLQFAQFTPTANVSTTGDYSAYAQTTPVRIHLGPVQQTPLDPLDATIADLSGGVDVVGMPAIRGRTIVVDPSRVDTFDIAALLAPLLDASLGQDAQLPDVSAHTFLYQRTGTAADNFRPATAATDPGIPQTNRQVRLSYSNFAAFTSVDPVGAPAPDIQANPFIGIDPIVAAHNARPGVTPVAVAADAPKGVTVKYGAEPAGGFPAGNFLLDTGASVSMLSSKTAGKLGITVGERAGVDANGDPIQIPYIMYNGVEVASTEQFTLPVGGISGSAELAGFYLDSLEVPTKEGDVLRWLHVPVLINDITLTGKDPYDPTSDLTVTLDGVFGMNLLIGSADFGGDILSDPTGLLSLEVQPSAFDWLVMDFTDGQEPTLGLNLKSEFVPEPASLSLLVLGAVAMLRRRFRSKTTCWHEGGTEHVVCL